MSWSISRSISIARGDNRHSVLWLMKPLLMKAWSAVSTRIESFQKLMMAESVVFGSARRFEILTLSTGDAVKYGSSDAKSDVESTATGSWNSLRRRLVASLSRCGIVSRSRTESTMIGTVVVSPAFGAIRVIIVCIVKNGRLSITPGESAAVIRVA